MGYRFTLESANTVANLTFGKVISCYRDIYSSKKNYNEFMYFLDQFNGNMYSNEKGRYMSSISRISKKMHESAYYKHSFEEVGYDNKFTHYDRDVLEALSELSEIFERCTIKSLLLPSMSEFNDYSDNFITSKETLNRLLRGLEGDSCLILQPQESPRTAAILDAFPNFDIALRQADLWPAVLFWDGHEDYAFVPVKNEKELFYLYETIRYDRNPMGEIKRIAEHKKETSHYLFQLSDLHFGARNVDVAERRLKSLLKSQLASIETDDSVSFIITGDAVDSPDRAKENSYRGFSEYLEEHCGTKPIRVLGNHDINNHGLAFFHGSQRIANIVGNYPKIEILNDLKVILLLFNSNTNGNLAEGEIGIEQMAEMGNLLDDVKNLSDYLLIAVMHHHLLPIPQPEFYDEKWYKKILPGSMLEDSLKLVDADLFMEWLNRRNIKIVIHGHKHIPFMAEYNGIRVISCGSSTGQITHREKGKTYISYNLLKISEKAVTCTQFAEEVYGAGAKNIRTETISFN